MIISCEKCETKYRLDASRLSYASVKVQCSKCDHIFIVPAAGEKDKERDIFVNRPHEDKDDKDSPSNRPEASPHGGHKHAGEATGPPLQSGEEEGLEVQGNGFTEEKENTDKGDLSFPREENKAEDGDMSLETDEAEPHCAPSSPAKNGIDTEREDVREEDETDQSATERDSNSIHEEGIDGADEASRNEAACDPQDQEGTADEKKEESEDAPLPWEVNSKTFDLSFGAEEDNNPEHDEAVAEGHEEEKASDDAPTGPEFNGINALDVDVEDEDKGLYNEEEDLEHPNELRATDFNLEELTNNKPDEDRSPIKEDLSDFPSFSDVLLDAASNAEKARDEGEPGYGEASQKNTFVIPEAHDAPDESEEGKRSGFAGIAIVIIIIIAIAGGLIYMKSTPENALMAEQTVKKPLEIESTKGYYVVNKNGGKIFVIETVLKNITDEPVKISGIRGLVMDSSGHEMARKMVSPGRIVTAEDIRNLPVETLLQSFQDTSEGTMPEKATIPTMILFTDLQKAVAEYGIDVLR